MPFQDAEVLSVYWILPRYYELFHDSKPMIYHTYMFDYEGENSIVSYLKDEGLIHALNAGGSSFLNGFSFFGVDMILT
jgi:secreted Zn-dependent insulinase-like peptidase